MKSACNTNGSKIDLRLCNDALLIFLFHVVVYRRREEIPFFFPLTKGDYFYKIILSEGYTRSAKEASSFSLVFFLLLIETRGSNNGNFWLWKRCAQKV